MRRPSNNRTDQMSRFALHRSSGKRQTYMGMQWKPDLVVDITLLATKAGGRRGPTPADWFGCTIIMPNGDKHDARMDLTKHGAIAPGEEARLPMKFINAEAALPKIGQGAVMQLWEMGVIGSAIVVTMGEDA